MIWLLYLYVFYFFVLAAAIGLYAETYHVAGGAVLLSVVCAHFVAGGIRYFTTDMTIKKRYSEVENIAADLLLLTSLGFAILTLISPEQPQWFGSGVALAVVGNLFCVYNHVKTKSSRTGTKVREWPYKEVATT